ncbi:uncharacterized protein LOC117781659 [Drosophila innubila]|uniref:uncharacterized protein LOC117781659 n=1 Tax=Drosophila innubila TaxID=198719 RepID=UPI00148E6C01|nr:uncharacterized protein LOC117781659 [Drosophila innubila]XP_034474360.1 uncharacterized protein LOC117781659 [Drosophila innubila]
MDELPADKTGSSNNHLNSSSKPNWCCIMDNLPVQGHGDGPMPYQPTKLFQWLSAKNLPQLEDETPPTSFYEVLENAEIAFHCTQCDKLLVSLNAESLQRTIGTQTLMLKQTQAQTQTLKHTGAQSVSQAQTHTPTGTPTLIMRRTRTPSPNPRPYRGTYPILQELWLLRERSLWSLLKTLLLCISLLNGCYLLCRGICRLAILRRILLCVQPAAPPPPPPPPQISNSLPAFLWSQLCRLARKLHII